MFQYILLLLFSVGDQIYYGELINTDGNKYTVQQLDGTPFDKLLWADKLHTVTDVFYAGLANTLTQISQGTISWLLSPVPGTALVICIGLIYKEHAKETSVSPSLSNAHGPILLIKWPA